MNFLAQRIDSLMIYSERPLNKNYVSFKNLFIKFNDNKHYNQLFHKYNMMDRTFVIVNNIQIVNF